MSENWTYAKAGVNIDKKSSAIESLVKELKYTRTGIGQMVHMKNLFASLIDFGDRTADQLSLQLNMAFSSHLRFLTFPPALSSIVSPELSSKHRNLFLASTLTRQLRRSQEKQVS